MCRAVVEDQKTRRKACGKFSWFRGDLKRFSGYDLVVVKQKKACYRCDLVVVERRKACCGRGLVMVGHGKAAIKCL